MTRSAAVVFAIVAVAGAATATRSPARAQQDLMRCMEQCLRHEGRDAKETCKLRCADIPSVTRPGSRPPGRQDCMARFKVCQKDCGGERECVNACKTELMNCN